MQTVPTYLHEECLKTLIVLNLICTISLLSHACYSVDPECPQNTCVECVVLSPDTIEDILEGQAWWVEVRPLGICL